MPVSEKDVQRILPRGQFADSEAINSILKFVEGIDLSEVVSTFLGSGMNVQRTIDSLIRKKISTAATEFYASKGFPQRAIPDDDFDVTFSSFKTRERVVQGNKRTGRLHETDAHGGIIKPSGRVKALLVGCNYYGTDAELQGCVPDCYRIRQLLNEVYQFPTDQCHMTILTDDQGMKDNKPTRKNIMKAFQWLRDGVRKGDTLFFHFSGHGVQVPSKKGTWWEKDQLDEAILPCDWQEGGYILDQEINQNLVTKLDEGVKLVCLVDCCHSGTAIDLPYCMDIPSKTWKEYENPFKTEGDVVVFTGCEDHQTSADIQTRQPAGAMTTAFVNTITDNLKDKTFSYAKLIDSIHDFMYNNGFSQRPQMNSSQPFPVSDPFSVTSIHGNYNTVVGPAGPKIKPTTPPPTSHDNGMTQLPPKNSGSNICRLCQPGFDIYNIVMNQIGIS